ncbi:hypothetical protein R1sor_019306 [Riccia sorocarpa]|uniref:SWIM-type domain-containing protein n=1 Tax=Riccia sorocarpa TaxID=122646 RepID=A0ABD3IIC7_9MARC
MGEAARIAIGAVFKDMAEFKFALRCWGVLRQRTYTWRKCKKTYRVAVCRYGRKPKPHSARTQNFFSERSTERPTPKNGFAGVSRQRNFLSDEAMANPWGCCVRGKLAKDTTVVITICELVHSCPGHLHSWRTSATAKWLADVLGNHVINNPSISVMHMQDVFRNEYGRQTTYYSMWRGKEIITEHIQGSESSSFQCIPAFCDALKAWEVYPGTKQFWRIFVCPSALGRAFPHLRPHIGLNACHSKNHKYPTQVLLATAMDGNNHVNYLAYAIVDRENEDSWTWFLLFLRRAVVGIEHGSVQFVSDRYKGIVNAVREVFHGQSHTHCTTHLERNLKRFGNKMDKEFQRLYRQSTEDSSECGTYVGNIDPKTYAAYAVPFPRFGHTTSNLVEVANSCILPLRSYAPFKLCYHLYLYVMELKVRRQNEAAEMLGFFTPYATEVLRKNEESAGSYRVRMASANQALVQSSRKDFIVTVFPTVNCTCLSYKDMLIPCPHVLAVEKEGKRNSDRLVDRVWTVDAFCAAHRLTLPPISTLNLKFDPYCLPPPHAVRKGRRRVRRIPGPGESSQTNRGGSRVQAATEECDVIEIPINDTRTSMEGVIPELPKKSRLCSHCRGSGHNKRTCPTLLKSLPSDVLLGTIRESPPHAVGYTDYTQTQETGGPSISSSPCGKYDHCLIFMCLIIILLQ